MAGGPRRARRRTIHEAYLDELRLRDAAESEDDADGAEEDSDSDPEKDEP